MTFYNYWGKAQGDQGDCHLLPYHSLDVAACAIQLLEARPEWRHRFAAMLKFESSDLEAWVGFFASIHDLGKFSDNFQGIAPNVRSALGKTGASKPYDVDVRHDSLGWMLYRQSLFKELGHPDAALQWVQSATGHHGQPPNRAPRGRIDTLGKYFTEADKMAAKEWVEKAESIFSPRWVDADTSAQGLCSWWIAGLITLADWIGSNKDWFPYEEKHLDIEDYFQQTQKRAKAAIEQASLGKLVSKWRSFSELFPDYQPTPMQQKIQDLKGGGPKLFIIEDLTGSGKTEAAITAAGDSFYFGLPTQATANGLWNRISCLAALEGTRSLIHSGRWLIPDKMRDASDWLNDSNRNALFATVGVGTIDQAELAVLYNKFHVLRLLALADKTLIIDEVHAYDPYQSEVLRVLVEFQAAIGGSVVLLSATLPKSERDEYMKAWCKGRTIPSVESRNAAFPLITHITDTDFDEFPLVSFSSRQMLVRFAESDDAVLDLIESEANKGECVCWIRNTVDEAIDAYKALMGRELDVELFHARFTIGDRAKIEARVLNRFGKNSTSQMRVGRILIATQVVEQSLDIDFDVLISDLAPIDLLVQRAGRQHRHDRGDRGDPTFWVNIPEWSDEPSKEWVSSWSQGVAFVYPDHGRLWLSVKCLKELQVIDLPLHARHIIEEVYGEASTANIPTGLQSASRSATDNSLADAATGSLNTVSTASSYQADGKKSWVEQYAPTRLGEQTMEWVLFVDDQPVSDKASHSVISLRKSMLKANHAPDIHSWQSKLVLLDRNGQLVGQAKSPKGEARQIRYDREYGLIIEARS